MLAAALLEGGGGTNILGSKYRMAGNIVGKLIWRLRQKRTILFPPNLISYDDA